MGQQAMDMELSVARCIASFTKDESLFGSAVPTILQNFCGLKDTPYFWQNNKEEAVRQIRLCLKGLPSADKKWELVAKLGAEEYRAKRGTLAGIKEIYSGLCVHGISEEQLNQLAENTKGVGGYETASTRIFNRNNAKKLPTYLPPV